MDDPSFCEDIELGPYYPYGSEDPGEAALDACTEQTGMTRQECIADSAAGNAS